MDLEASSVVRLRSLGLAVPGPAIYAARTLDELPATLEDALFAELLPEDFLDAIRGRGESIPGANGLAYALALDYDRDPFYLFGLIVVASGDPDVDLFVRGHEEAHLAHAYAPARFERALRRAGFDLAVSRAPVDGDAGEIVAHLGSIHALSRRAGFDRARIEDLAARLPIADGVRWTAALELAERSYRDV